MEDRHPASDQETISSQAQDHGTILGLCFVLQLDVFMISVFQEPYDLQLVQSIEEGVMGLVVCTVAGEQAEHGLDAVASFQAAGGAQVSGGGDLGVVLAVGGEAHDVVPIKVTEFW